MFRFFPALFLVAILTQPGISVAQDLPNPTGTVLLTVSGDITSTNGDGIASFDLDMLMQMPSHTVSTSTIWTDGVQEFEGFALSDLTKLLGVEGGTLHMIAKNDYAIDFPVQDLEHDAPVIAYYRNGATMSVRDKGPLWLVYPYDQSLDYQTEVVFNRSIWQLDRIDVRKD